jgi:hypothetical protein
MTLEELLKEVVHKLEKQNISYMISGSLALSAYEIPRMTRDVDIIIELELEQIDSFVHHFTDHYYLHKPSIIEETTQKGMFNVIDNRSGYKIDFILRKNFEYRKTEFLRRKKMKIMGIDMWVVSVEDLILSKLLWIQQLQSEKQMEDIRNLLQDANPDRGYLNEWINKLNMNTFGLL